MMCYPSILNLKNKKIMMYNGNNYGEKGFHFAEKSNSFKCLTLFLISNKFL